jgi:metallo-beta-lactamase family protein
MKITFLGAAKTVTGSCFMVETNETKILIDCGMFQGKTTDQMLNYEAFPFNVNDITCVILTHAHIDHSGRIPKLYKEGYTGVVYATSATKDLCNIMLADSGHIQEKEIEWVNKKRVRAGKKPIDPMYTEQDGIDSLKLFKGVNYGQRVDINDNMYFIMKDAGHMLGSAIIELYITEDGKQEKFVFSGDLGNLDMPILKDPTYIEGADHLVMESTYGDRLHDKIEDQSEEFINTILKTIERGGNVIIPSFAVGRTQEMLYEINKYAAQKGIGEKIKKIPVYVDSPMATSATKVFEQHPEYYDEDTLAYLLKGDNPLEFDNLKFTASAEESKELNMDLTPKIIISASGMCEVGRIKHHLKHNLYRPESTILFVGFQAEGTLGRKILSGEKTVKIFGEEIAVKAEIVKLNSFSGHADKNGLLEWINKMVNKPNNIFLVHGEDPAQQSLKNSIIEKFGITNINIPGYGESYTPDGIALEIEENKYKSTRFDILEMISVLKEDVDKVTKSVKSEIKNTSNEEDLSKIYSKLDELKSYINNFKK